MSLILSGTDGLSDVDGTAATPAIRGTDTNTGIFFPAADTVAASVGGTEGLRLTSTGLGVGTSSWSTSKLYVLGNTTNYGITSEAPDGYGSLNLKQTSGNTMSIGMASNGLFIYDANAGTTRLTLDSSGNLGLGVTPSAWSASFKAFQLGTKGAFYGSTSATVLSDNVYNDGSPRYLTTAAAGNYVQSGGTHYWQIAPSGTAGNTISFTQAMTLDASGNLLVGTTSNAYGLSGRGLIEVNGSNDSLIALRRGGVSATYLQNASDGFYINNTASTSIILATNNTERARITSGGDLLVKTTTYAGDGVSISGTQGNNFWFSKTTSTAAYNQLVFANPNGNVGFIQTAGSSTSYVTSSDYRLKENIQPMTGALAKVVALKPCTYKWKVDGSDGEGFIAHELAEVVPQAVTGDKDAIDEDGNPKYQGIDTSFLVATLTAAIQEQQAIIESLTARITALEAK